ncbi:peptidoglycan-binding protein [Actinoplanes sp. TBRC 11911]|uniref:peptidoglycan-binding domain-containing protein n=1 Tax=Actinoplanes sp. TBRC 11911 TaxID=2729386 RepID=UPI00145EB7B1|nr:peptidoglycan-binding domain-containing protein [Actinoplanes sp. TBRC 11911]NMO53752.1 peptidoglycan-binding protein [Actinoplanes sp. TBRC 11911]
MRTTLKRIGAVCAAAVLGLGVSLAGAGAANADPVGFATASCTKAAQFRSGAYEAQYVPVTASGSTNCGLSRGNNSTAVWGLQNNLNICYNRSLVPDGDFGTNTYNALVYAQGVMGAGKDGQFGPETRSKMSMYFALSGTTPLCIKWSTKTWTFDHFQS